MDKSTAGLTTQSSDGRGRAQRPLSARPAPTDALAARFAERMTGSKVASGHAAPVKGKDKAAVAHALPQAPMPPSLKSKEGARPQPLHGETDRAEGEGAAAIGRAAPVLRSVAADAPRSLPRGAAAEPHPALARIAAAVAELHGDRASDVMRIDFPSESHTALGGSAVLTRDVASGAVSIQLTGLVPHATPTERGLMEADLRRGLAKRRLRVGEVHWDDAPGWVSDESGLPVMRSR